VAILDILAEISATIFFFRKAYFVKVL